MTEPPRLQDTTERSALPLPLPAQPYTMAFAAPSDDEASTDETDAVPEVDPEAPAPIPEEEPAAAEPSGTGDGQPDLDPLFAPPAAESLGADPAEAGPSTEVLVGAAFLGGVALAFFLKRLGS